MSFLEISKLCMDSMEKTANGIFNATAIIMIISIIAPIIIGIFNATAIIMIISIIAPIIIGIVAIIFIVKAVKKNKTKSSISGDGGIISSFTDAISEGLKTHIKCEYCGAENKKENTSCEKCGAALKRKKK